MSGHSTSKVDRIRSISMEYDFPKPLQFQEYRDKSHQADVIQVYFRYHPFSDVSEKFGFEISFTDSTQSKAVSGVYEEEIHRRLSDLESMWKNHFQFIIYRGVPHAKKIENSTYHLKCELCGEQLKIEGENLEENEDIILLYYLKEIGCSCDDEWSIPSSDKDLRVEEASMFPRDSI